MPGFQLFLPSTSGILLPDLWCPASDPLAELFDRPWAAFAIVLDETVVAGVDCLPIGQEVISGAAGSVHPLVFPSRIILAKQTGIGRPKPEVFVQSDQG